MSVRLARRGSVSASRRVGAGGGAGPVILYDRDYTAKAVQIWTVSGQEASYPEDVLVDDNYRRWDIKAISGVNHLVYASTTGTGAGTQRIIGDIGLAGWNHKLRMESRARVYTERSRWILRKPIGSGNFESSWICAYSKQDSDFGAGNGIFWVLRVGSELKAEHMLGSSRTTPVTADLDIEDDHGTIRMFVNGVEVITYTLTSAERAEFENATGVGLSQGTANSNYGWERLRIIRE